MTAPVALTAADILSKLEEEAALNESVLKLATRLRSFHEQYEKFLSTCVAGADTVPAGPEKDAVLGFLRKECAQSLLISCTLMVRIRAAIRDQCVSLPIGLPADAAPVLLPATPAAAPTSAPAPDESATSSTPPPPPPPTSEPPSSPPNAVLPLPGPPGSS